jgi:hypothetical protein
MRTLDGLLQASQGIRPELVKQAAEWLERLWAQCVESARPLAALGEQTGPLEYGEVLADRLLGDVEVGGDLAGGQLAVLDQPQDLAPMRVGERPQDCVGPTAGSTAARPGGRRRLLWLGHRYFIPEHGRGRPRGSVAGVLRLQLGEPLRVDHRVRRSGRMVDVGDEAGEVAGPPGVAHLEALGPD